MGCTVVDHSVDTRASTAQASVGYTFRKKYRYTYTVNSLPFIDGNTNQPTLTTPFTVLAANSDIAAVDKI